MKIPYLETRIETDLLLTLVLTPLWWVLGLNVLIYQGIALLVFLKLFTRSILNDQPLRLPRPLAGLGIFLMIYFTSMVLNAGDNPFQRTLASLNNYSMFVMGFFIIFALYHSAPDYFLIRFFKAAHTLNVMTAGIAVLFLGLWFWRGITFEIDPLLARFYPGLKSYPFFYILWIIRGVISDWTLAHMPRISIYSGVHIATGGFMAMMIPLSLGYQRLKNRSGLVYSAVLLISLIPLFFSLSRTSVCAFAASFVVVHMIRKGLRGSWCFVYFCAAFFGLGMLYRGLQWLLSIRAESNSGRMDIYAQAVSLVMHENPLLGLGARPRDEFSTMIVGSHSHYIEILLVTGILGFSAFFMFQVSTLLSWYSQRKNLASREQEIMWTYLGISHIAADAVLLTSGLDSLPFIAFTYFLTAGAILMMGRWLQSNAV